MQGKTQKKFKRIHYIKGTKPADVIQNIKKKTIPECFFY